MSLAHDWVIGYSNQVLIDVFAQRLQTIAGQPESSKQPRILLAESEPIDFLAGFLAACTAQCPVFLGNLRWATQDWQQVLQKIQPDLIWGQVPIDPLPHLPPPSPVEPGWILIPTGGSSGEIRFVIHTWQTLTASVSGLMQSGLVPPSGKINSFCTLPLYHVSGLMQVMRSLLTQGQLAIVPFKTFEQFLKASPNPDTYHADTDHKTEPWQSIDPSTFFLSLVPTQLQRLLNNEQLEATHPPAFLTRFHTIFLGGAPAWPELLDRARHYKLSIAPTYGMTETASQVVTLTPAAFLQGQTGCGKSLPHARITIRDDQGNGLEPGQVGKIWVESRSLGEGYYGEFGVSPSETLRERGSEFLLRRRCANGVRSSEFGDATRTEFGVRSSETLRERSSEFRDVTRMEFGFSPLEMLRKRGLEFGVSHLETLREGDLKFGEALSLKHGFTSRELELREFETDDLGYLDSEGFLHVVGRSSEKIISGGENVFPIEVEAAIQKTGWVADVAVVGIPDQHWGEEIVALYVPLSTPNPVRIASPNSKPQTPNPKLRSRSVSEGETPNPELRTLFFRIPNSEFRINQLSSYKHPKHWIPVEQIPRNAQGKVNRQQLRSIALQALKPTVATTASSPKANLGDSVPPDECTHDGFELGQQG